MTREQFEKRAQTIHRKIEELEKSDYIGSQEEREANELLSILHEAKWRIFDLAYPA